MNFARTYQADGPILLNCGTCPAEIVIATFCQMPGFKVKWSSNTCGEEEIEDIILPPVSLSVIKATIEIEDISALGFKLNCGKNKCDGLKTKILIDMGTFHHVIILFEGDNPWNSNSGCVIHSFHLLQVF